MHDRVGTSLYRCRSFSLPSSVNTHARSTVRNGLMRDVDSQGLGMRNPIHHSLTIQAIPNMCTAVQFLTVYLTERRMINEVIREVIYKFLSKLIWSLFLTGEKSASALS